METSAPARDRADSTAGSDEDVDIGEACPPPRSSYDETQGQPPERDSLSEHEGITEEEAREALVQYVANHCCYGKSPAQDLTFTDIKRSCAFHVGLYCTDVVKKPCHACNQTGRVRESGANGSYYYRSCYYCKGGRTECTWCNQTGKQRCLVCEGTGKLKWYTRLTIKWRNHVEDYILNGTSLPDKKIRKVAGHEAFKEEHPRVWPINHFHEEEINTASRNLVQKHSTAFPDEKILMQRHQVRIIPVAEASYDWKAKDYNFIVYGLESKVYAPDYPQKCCCGCSIL
uniref:Uncharacterized protein n=1 Tax=Branchiostoma floridae TaxID=7739 RepID=C3XQL0_BRAFL|eukprot:XP_002613667.1 hypothetical protein BRAFLDRAFT_66534 [Branchiostoma floridae]